jgi:hypothetical protein
LESGDCATDGAVASNSADMLARWIAGQCSKRQVASRSGVLMMTSESSLLRLMLRKCYDVLTVIELVCGS